MDFGVIEESLAVGKLSAYIAIGITVLLSILAAVFVA